MQPIDTTASAFVAGLVTSLHCVGMCGPLACSWAARTRQQYHLSPRHGAVCTARLIAYGIVGTLAGWLGTVPMMWMREHHGVAVFPWLLVVAFVLVGIGADAWLPKPAFLTMPMARLRLKAIQLSSRGPGKVARRRHAAAALRSAVSRCSVSP